MDMAEALTGINGKIIQWARELYNISEEEAAKSIGVHVEQYCSWENGTDFPTYAMLKKISSVFRKPIAIFFFPEPPERKQIKGDLRSLPDTIINNLSKEIIIQFEKAKVYQINLRELYGERECLFMHKDKFPSEMQALCDYIRKELNFSITEQKKKKNTRLVFDIFRERFYDIGIYVFKDSFKDNNISGLCLNDERFPVIMINNSMSFSRQTFTLFHELYHLISNTSGAEIIRDDYYIELNKEQSNIEHSCDAFANMFLVPPNDFTNELQSINPDEQGIFKLSKLYSVSKEAIMYKLWTLGKITSTDYNNLKETFYGDAIRKHTNRKDSQSGGNYYLTKLSYLGQKYTQTVFEQYFIGAINDVRASELLSSKVDQLPKLESAFFRGDQK